MRPGASSSCLAPSRPGIGGLDISTTSQATAAGSTKRGCPVDNSIAKEGCALEIGSRFSSLSKSLAKCGVPILSIDHVGARAVSKGPSIRADLRLPSGWEVAYDLLNSGKLAYVHMELPRGTTNPNALTRLKKRFGARPMARVRTRRFPDGVPAEPAAARRLGDANAIFELSVQFAKSAIGAGVATTVGTMAHSLFWTTGAARRLLDTEGLVSTSFTFSEFGGGRSSRHRFVWTLPSIGTLETRGTTTQPPLHEKPLAPTYPAKLQVAIAGIVRDHFRV